MDDWLGDASLGLAYGQVRLVASDPGWPEAFQRLAGRLRADPAARSTYARLKGRLAAQYSGDRRASTAAKVAFIQQLLSGD